MDEKLRALEAEIEAKGWPTYTENRELCMERAREYLDGRDALLATEKQITAVAGKLFARVNKIELSRLLTPGLGPTPTV